MKRRSFLMGGALSAAACGGGPRLNVYNWSDYIAPTTVSGFERESGARVHYGTYESNQEMLAQVMSGNSGWDVVFPSEDFVGPMQELGLLAPIQHDRLPNLSALAPAFQRPPWDPELRWGVPYMHGVTGILYQKALQPEPRSWADLWDPRLRGRLTMLDDQPEVLGACLKKLARSVNSSDPGDLLAARREALAQKPLLRAYLNAEVRDQAVAGDVLAAQAWAVTAAQAIAAAPGKLAFSCLRKVSRGLPTTSRFCAKAVEWRWRTAGSITCCGRRSPRRSWRPFTRPAPMEPRSSFCRSKCGRMRCCTRRRRLWRAANGFNPSRRLRKNYGIACGRRLRAPNTLVLCR